MITQKDIKKILKYSLKNGMFTWAIGNNNVSIGDIAGCINKNLGGYVQISINRKKYYGHRLAWLWVNGAFPKKDICHINGDLSDNSINNLKEFTKTNEPITQERLKKLLTYDGETGLFTCKVNRRRVAKKGDIPGFVRNGYLFVGLENNEYRAHRLAWLYTYGYFPENGLDHINRNRLDNRIKNLREVSQSCNIRNIGNLINNTSGVKGVSFIKKENRWVSYIGIHGKRKTLGRYKSFDNAVCARLATEQCLGWNSCDSLSPAHKYVMENIAK